jgi:hypothetical protein
MRAKRPRCAAQVAGTAEFYTKAAFGPAMQMGACKRASAQKLVVYSVPRALRRVTVATCSNNDAGGMLNPSATRSNVTNVTLSCPASSF